LYPSLAGMPWWAAIALALGLTAAGALADVQRLDRLGILFQACYCLGCLLAVILVQRKGLFGPMVAPPLILATAVPGVVLLAGSLPAAAGTAATVLAVGTPLINGFPTMAITTGLTLAVGGLRLVTRRPVTGSQRRSAEPDFDELEDQGPPTEPIGPPLRPAAVPTPVPRRRRRA